MFRTSPGVEMKPAPPKPRAWICTRKCSGPGVRPLAGMKQEAQVERRGGVGERPYADRRDPRLRDRPHGVEADVAGGRCLAPTVSGAGDRRAQLLCGHVV